MKSRRSTCQHRGSFFVSAKMVLSTARAASPRAIESWNTIPRPCRGREHRVKLKQRTVNYVTHDGPESYPSSPTARLPRGGVIDESTPERAGALSVLMPRALFCDKTVESLFHS